MKRPLYAFLLFSILGFHAHAQLTSCTQTLRLARSTYEQGRLHDIPSLFEKCLQSGFSQEEKVEAYKLLCLTYIYLEEPQKADEAMLNLLRTNNYFEIKPETDPAEFVALYRTFRTEPIYRLGAKLGGNTTHPNVVSFLPSNDLDSEYDFGFAMQGGVAVDIPLKILSGKLTLHPELMFMMKSFKYSNEGTYTDITPDNEPFTRDFETNAIENHSWISLPISLQYRVSDKKLKPYVGLGISTDYLIRAQNKFSRTKEDAPSLNDKTIDIRADRNSINLSAIATVGVKIKVTGGFALAEIRYSHGLTNVNTKESIYSSFDRINPTGGYADGIFKLNTLSMSVGYMYNRFNPKKLRK